MEKLLLIKYGELTTKKGNRKVFIKMLCKNIEKILYGINYNLEQNLSCMYIKVEEKDLNVCLEKLLQVFGIHSIAICESVNNNIEDIQNKVVEILKNKNFNSFKIETKRSNKKFSLNSLEVSSKIGGFVLKNISCKVDVHNPDILVNVEIRGEATYIYVDVISGLGGYPVGIQ